MFPFPFVFPESAALCLPMSASALVDRVSASWCVSVLAEAGSFARSAFPFGAPDSTGFSAGCEACEADDASALVAAIVAPSAAAFDAEGAPASGLAPDSAGEADAVFVGADTSS
ncbi:hypothetical protein BTK96_006795 [Burkholderia pyrrocinia]|nr:hypothetical protein [Burkholderia pyrrocinia]EKS9898495.1 hypothetical protein [Burkholderia pyrrocinia]